MRPSIPVSELSVARLWQALTRRVGAVPHNLDYLLTAGPGSANYQHLADMRDLHHGERCFILGNGPSLRRTDLAQLGHETTFGLNRIFLLFGETEFRPSYFVCINDLIVEQSSQSIAGLQMLRFLNWRMRSGFPPSTRTLLLRESFRPHFSTDIRSGVWGGGTVTYVALQIAYFMGFSTAVLLGVDHKYSTPGTPHSVVVAHGPDRDHFDEGYFAKGFRWQLPDLRTSEYAYQLARQAYERDGRRILDATVGGHLTIFEKRNLDDLSV